MTEAVREAQHGGAIADMTDLILAIAKALVDMPDAVGVHAYSEAGATVLRLHVDQTDIGKIIGKQGRTARSLRTILGAASMKAHHRYSLDIVDNSRVVVDNSRIAT